MNVGSLFSGIGGLDLGLHRAGHRVVFQCESDPYRRRVLARHWPGVPCFEDIRTFDAASWASRVDAGRRAMGGGRDSASSNGSLSSAAGVDLICGGFPCQDLSVAGRRAGLDGGRSGLFFEFARVADALLPDGGWVLVENVPGLLSSNGGRDFAVLLSTLAELGFHDLAWRVLDSRYLGVPQRRRRIFILARRAGGRCASEVLLEPESGGGDFEAGREAGQGAARGTTDGLAFALRRDPGGIGQQHNTTFVAKPLGAKNPDQGGYRNDLDHDSYVVAGTVRSHARPGSNEVGSIVSFDAAFGRNSGIFDGESPPLKIGSGVGAPAGPAILSSSPDPNGVRTAPRAARHLDDPDWPNPRPDGPRYAACGDAVTVNVAEWIGKRLMEFA